jgi:hypothetical protein
LIVKPNSFHYSGSFRCTLPLFLHPAGLDELINSVEQFGQQMKHSVSVVMLEAADSEITQLVQNTSPDYRKLFKIQEFDRFCR